MTSEKTYRGQKITEELNGLMGDYDRAAILELLAVFSAVSFTLSAFCLLRGALRRLRLDLSDPGTMKRIATMLYFFGQVSETGELVEDAVGWLHIKMMQTVGKTPCRPDDERANPDDGEPVS